MNRRDPNFPNRQAGSYDRDDSGSDTPRQASQWQSDSDRQSGGWETDANERTDYFRQDRAAEGRYSGDESTGTRYREDQQWRAGRERGYRESADAGRTYRDSGRSAYGEGYAGDRANTPGSGYRFSGSRGEGTHAFDASGGNDFRSFTSEDYGRGDFSRSGSGGVTGGLHPSNTYRESYGPGSWGRHRDEYDADAGEHDSWRAYGERRGFFQRAGDEVASWFGDDDAARRREADHRGRGPSDYTRSDERIREDINDALTHDWRLDASHVRVTVKDGEVTLEGTVDSRQDKRRAEDLADNITGAHHVQNNLRLNSTSAQARGAYGSTSASSSTSGTGAIASSVKTDRSN